MPRIGFIGLRRGSLAGLAAACATALTVAACSSGSSAPAASGGSSGSNAALPTVTMMVGGIDKQIYLPYQLAQSLGYYKKYGVNMVLSNEVSGGVGAETAMASGQVDMAGAWYVHTINFQLQGKSVVDVAQLSGSPGERIMCATGTHITSPTQWKGQTIGVTDIGSGTDQLTQYLAARYGLTKGDYTRIGAGDGSTMIAALKNHKILCGMTTQPTVAAIEKLGVGYPAFDLTTTAGVQKWLGGFTPTAGVLALSSWVDANKATVQKVVDALVATMHWLSTHSAADVANVLPPSFVNNTLVTKPVYISTLATDKTQFLPDGMMPSSGPTVIMAISKLAGVITGPVNVPATYTNSYAIAANKALGY
ncbi:MAG TPA: ABC transporter substrate-binding protein [Streptosporangiaceae bacterium]|nr:ABC transporter substrate-binding protein [Streptosporangiaceae bacterium]